MLELKEKWKGRVLESTPSVAKEVVDIWQESREALLGLGYREGEIRSLLDDVLNSENPPKKVEDVVKSALKQL